MAEELIGRRSDDAPLSTSKEGTARRAAVGVVDAPEDSVVSRTVTIRKPIEQVYAAFRDFARLPAFMENVERIDVIDEKRSHWVVKAPAGPTVEWDAVVTEEREPELIAWRSVEGADVENSGRVVFRDAGPRGTVVTATIAYDPPAGFVGKLIAKVFQREPAIQARRDLRRFKQLLETGEIATNAMNPAQQRARED
jgi:uncharacterized membrane protein